MSTPLATRIGIEIKNININLTDVSNSLQAETTRATAAENNINATLETKVDKISGMGLSTNDYTTTDKSIVDSVTSNVQTINNRLDSMESTIVTGSAIKGAFDTTSGLDTLNESTLQEGWMYGIHSTNDVYVYSKSSTTYSYKPTGWIGGFIQFLNVSDVANLVSNETNRAITAEQANTTAITAETARATAAEQANVTAITNEVTRATGIEGTLSNLTTANKTNLVNAINEVLTDVNNEVTRAEAAEASINTTLSTKAPLASPAFSGPVTGASFNSITALSSTAPIMDGTSSIGTSTTVARADHIHPSDTTKVNTSLLGATNGVATLDVNGKLLTSQIPAALVGAIVYQGLWNASTNSPALSSGTGTKGNYYKVSVAGSITIDGISSWNIGDIIIFNGTTWDKIDGIASEVVSVAGRTGAVTLGVSDISGAAPLASPALTGNPTAPTAATADNSSAIANTALVHNKITALFSLNGTTLTITTTGI